MPNRLDRLYVWAERLERWLARGVAVSILALVGVQALMTNDPARGYLSAVERLEGRRIDVAAAPDGDPLRAVTAAVGRDAGRVVIHLINRESAPRAFVRVNGTPLASFGQPRVEVSVRPGDFLEIDGSADPAPLLFRVTAVDRRLLSPELGREVMTRGDVQPLGRVAPAP